MFLLKKICVTIVLFVCTFSILSCATTPTRDPIQKANEEFLNGEDAKGEVFRVLITSDEYRVIQLKYLDNIKRVDDPGGDKYICEELRKYDKIDEVREGRAAVWLFPDSGSIMKIRPVELTYLVELDNIIVQDLQRWSFTFPKKDVTPTKFEVVYRFVLRKKLSDDEIMDEVREMIKEKS
ncbi:MAG: hypothetical protein ACOCX9_05320 [Spirochaetota bacterium]